MSDRIRAKAPVHLWIVGILALAWNAFGSFDYLMTRTQGAAYIQSMMPGVNAQAMMDYIDGFPIWVSSGWALGVWGGLAGAILLLVRSRWALTAYVVSLIGAIVSMSYQWLRPVDIPGMTDGMNGVMPYVIIVVAALQAYYARAMTRRGVLA